MKNKYLQEDKEIISQINRSFLEKVGILILYLFTFRVANKTFRNEDKFFTHLTQDKTILSKLVFAFSLIVTFTIFLSAIIYLIKRHFLRKYRHIRSNLFFLNSGWVTALNCLMKICGYTVITISFMNLSRLALTVFFITVFYLLERKKNPESQLSPGFFSWSDKNLRSLLVYSLSLAILIPIYETASATNRAQIIKDRIVKSIEEMKDSIPTEARKDISNTFPNIPFGSLLVSARKIIVDILSSKTTKGGVLLIILLGYAKGAVDQSISSFGSFWKEIASTGKKVEWFKLFSNFQSIAKDKKARNFAQGINGFPTLCNESFTLNPNFIKQSYIEDEKSFDRKFVDKIKSVNNLIKLVTKEIKNTKEKNFVLYWIFNCIGSFDDFDSYKEAINNKLETNYSDKTVT